MTNYQELSNLLSDLKLLSDVIANADAYLKDLLKYDMNSYVSDDKRVEELTKSVNELMKEAEKLLSRIGISNKAFYNHAKFLLRVYPECNIEFQALYQYCPVKSRREITGYRSGFSGFAGLFL